MASIHWIFRPDFFPTSRGLRQCFRSVLDRCEAAENLITIPKKTSKSLESLRKPDGFKEFLGFSMGCPFSFDGEVTHFGNRPPLLFHQQSLARQQGSQATLHPSDWQKRPIPFSEGRINLKLATSRIQRKKEVKRVKGEF